MSSGFGGFGSGGFGSTANNNQQSTGFGGFGSTAGTTGGFGTSNTGTGFGATNTSTTGGGLFGNTSGSGFGSGGFGANATSSPFGQNKTGFGATATTSSGGLFGGGGTTATSGSTFGGFGSTASTPAFGSGTGTSTGGLFGQSKPAFGSTTSGSLFGGGGGSSSGFGTTAASTGFGASAAPAFGGGANAANEGTGKVPFSEFTEKDPSATNTTNRYQTISTIDPYKQWSLEELRLVDYTQGRKYGNQNGQAGAFGTSTGFGGFGGSATPASTGFGTTSGTTGGGLFGGNSASTGFGQQASATTGTGFGSSATGGLFGAKPAATGGLFGGTAATTTPATGGGLFGGSSGTGFGSGAASTGFGSSTTTGGGLFGSAAAKPATAFGGFGSTATSTAGTGTGFGSTGFGSTTAPATGGGLFGGGSGTTGTGFGAQAQPAATGGFSFGQQNQQASQPAQTGGGLFGGGGAFGQNNQQQKPGGLFGSAAPATGGGLFGQPAQPQPSTGGGLFGGGAQQQSTGGLFGAKPATGGGLFGSSATGTTGGLFGGSQPQQTQTGGGLFGGSQQQSGGLFGSKPATTGLGSSLFGGNQNQQQQSTAGGLFGGSQQQQPTMGGLFGGSQQQQQPQQPQALTANLLQNPYGNDALFANIPATQSVGPIATPLSTSQKNKKPAMIPSYRLNPSASSRLLTPQKRPAGYGFSYSTYGTPGSAISNASPLGLGNSLLSASSYGRSLNKSMSTSNLRSSFSAEDSILNPGAFANTSRGGTGSLKKLNINKNMNVRRSLFGPTESPSESRKSVSFEAPSRDTSSASGLFGPSNGQLVRTENPPAEPRVTSPNGSASLPEMSQVNGMSRGKELAIVPENGSPAAHGPPAVEVPLSQKDKLAGEYYMNPSEQQIANMSRDQKSNVKDFTVGRHGCGKIVFSKVNFYEVNPQDIFDKIVKIQTRQATVYGDELVAKKPPRGQGLNVPSTITLENSWPRSAAGLLPVHEKKGLRYDKHIKRLKRVNDTNFVDYNDKTGEWTFSVEHFTTYGFPEDDDESMMEDSVLEDIVNEAPGTPTPSKHSRAIMTHVSPPFTSDSSLPSPPESSPDDTFDFKKGPRKHLPGQFSDEDLGDVNMAEEEEEITDTAQSFLGERSVGSLEDDDMSQASESGTAEDQEMAGSFPKPAHTTEQSAASHTMNGEALKPKSILKASQTVNLGTPLKTGQLLFGADWAEQLQRTVSPKKQDRAALRANQPTASAPLETEPTRKTVHNDKPFTTSIDLINELFSRSAAGRKTVPAKLGDRSRDFEHPPPKRAKTRSAQETSANDEAFHNSTKPNWGPHGTLVYTAQPVAPAIRDGNFQNVGKPIVGEHNDVRFARFSTAPNLIPGTIEEQRITCSQVHLQKAVPFARTDDDFEFDIFAEKVALDTESGIQEQRAWELANILFDDLRLTEVAKDFEPRVRKQALSAFWKRLVHADTLAQVSRAQSAEEKAFVYLSGGMIEEACMALIDGKDFHLATLVAQIGGDKTFRAAMATQLESWRQLNVLPEIDDHIRAIWELLAGNTSICEGQTVAGIENKVASFSFSSRFKIDWRRSFGLRLWYGIEAADDTSVAVKKFRSDLKSHTETAKPVPWFVQKGVEEGWNDSKSSTCEDVLWSMLRLYTNNASVALDTAFAPENVSGNPMDARLSFQLVYLFSARGIGSTASGPASADDLATTYASCLSASIASNSDALWYACWALLHLSEPQARVQSVRALLDQHAAVLDPDGKVFNELLNLRIPSSWMYLSRALYARAVEQDPVMEAQCLMEAGEWSQAHDVVCRVVGPKAVIEGDSDQLRELLGSLVDRSSTNQAIWDKGAGVYYDYIEMKDLEVRKGQRWKELVRRVASALKGIMTEGLQGKDLIERAALQIMGRTVANIATSGDVLEKNEGLRLPLTEDAYLAQSRELSKDYFRALLASH